MRLTITIECTPKPGRADRIDQAINQTIRKHAKKRGLTINTQYHHDKEDE